MWTPTTRQQHSRTVTRYQTDLTDAEWHVIAPHLPKPCATGRPREFTTGLGYQIAVAPNYRPSPQTPAYSNAWLFTSRFNF